MTDTGRHRPPAEGRAGSRAYAKARRHSGRVRFLRRLIPVGAAIAIGFVAVIALFDPFERIGGLSLGPISLSGTKIKMENPRLSGYRSDTRPYEVTATAAMQDVRKPTLVELVEMRGKLTLDDAGNTARIEAETGVFDTQKEQLEVRRNVRMRTDNGQEADLLSAVIDFKAGSVVSNEPVKVKLPDATIEADGLTVQDNGKTITFTGNVRSMFDISKADTKTAAAVAPVGSAAEPTSLRP